MISIKLRYFNLKKHLQLVHISLDYLLEITMNSKMKMNLKRYQCEYLSDKLKGIRLTLKSYSELSQLELNIMKNFLDTNSHSSNMIKSSVHNLE